MKVVLIAITIAACVSGQVGNTTPVPILRQINNVNDDGSYTYGYEAADGTFKVENRDSQGNVKGKYGYLDETGQLKTVEYSAGGIGFVAAVDHLPVTAVPPAAPAAPAAPVAQFRAPVAVPDQHIPVVTEHFTHNANLPGHFIGQFSQNANSAPHFHQFVPSPATFLQTFGHHRSSHQDPGFGFAFSAPTIFPQQFAPHPFAQLLNNRFVHL